MISVGNNSVIPPKILFFKLLKAPCPTAGNAINTKNRIDINKEAARLFSWE
jgi:hypothetical protein